MDKLKTLDFLRWDRVQAIKLTCQCCEKKKILHLGRGGKKVKEKSDNSDLGQGEVQWNVLLGADQPVPVLTFLCFSVFVHFWTSQLLQMKLHFTPVGGDIVQAGQLSLTSALNKWTCRCALIQFLLHVFPTLSLCIHVSQRVYWIWICRSPQIEGRNTESDGRRCPHRVSVLFTLKCWLI